MLLYEKNNTFYKQLTVLRKHFQNKKIHTQYKTTQERNAILTIFLYKVLKIAIIERSSKTCRAH